MVKTLTSRQKETIAAASAEAKRVTDAEIVTVIVPASDSYQSHVLIYGFISGSIVAMGLWAADILTDFPVLMLAQLAGIAFMLLPVMHRLCMKIVPKRILHHRAAHRAFETYLYASRRHGPHKPVIVLYVSLAERYVHLIPSRCVREKISDSACDAIVTAFTSRMGSGQVADASAHAIGLIAAALAPHFPHKP